MEDDRVVGRGEASRRPDGRIFLSVDAWHGTVSAHLADAMFPDLPKPLYTVVDEADLDLTYDGGESALRPGATSGSTSCRPNRGSRTRLGATAVGRDDGGHRRG
jgi:hypothetical protein